MNIFDINNRGEVLVVLVLVVVLGFSSRTSTRRTIFKGRRRKATGRI